MQQSNQYPQSRPVVNRGSGRQTHRCSVLIGNIRVRVSGDFETIMGWVRLALAEKEAAA